MENIINIYSVIKSALEGSFEENKLKFILYLALFGFILSFGYYLIKYFNDHRIISSKIESFSKNVNTQIETKKREMEQSIEDNEIKSYGKFLLLIDDLISNSGLKRKVPELTAGLFLLMTLFLSFLISIIISVFFDSAGLGFAIGGAFFSGILITLSIFCERRAKKTEAELKLFIGLLKNYSLGTDDIIHLFSETAPKLDGPIKPCLEEFVYEVRSGSSLYTSFDNLCRKVGHPQFEKIIGNLRLATNNSANYRKVLELNEITLDLFLSAREKDRAIKRNARIELLILFIFGNLIFKMVQQMGFMAEVPSDLIGTVLSNGGNVVLVLAALATLKK